MRRIGIAAALAATALGAPTAAHAFCGFYINGAGGEMFNNATQVVLMRQGTRTVLSMQNNYQGPPQDFAMVIPVPVVLQEPDVKTLTKEVFAKVDAMGAPRLVEYWEQDPCRRKGTADILEISNLSMQQSKAAQDYQQKMQDIQSKNNQAMQKLQLEKEKLNVARENMKNDVEVAKINASNRASKNNKK